ncbi:hypothetical protein, partial [Escherichia albertii]|uniref:hypothetical protein n=1 Tax=Escherichia albertii TaxID=208962 RepID=UPI001F1DE46E
GEKRVFLVILFTSFSGSLVSRIPGAVQCGGRIQRIDSIPILIVKIQIEVYLSVILQMICGSFT